MLSLYYRSKNFDLRFFHQIHMWPNNFVIRISLALKWKNLISLKNWNGKNTWHPWKLPKRKLNRTPSTEYLVTKMKLGSKRHKTHLQPEPCLFALITRQQLYAITHQKLDWNLAACVQSKIACEPIQPNSLEWNRRRRRLIPLWRRRTSSVPASRSLALSSSLKHPCMHPPTHPPLRPASQPTNLCWICEIEDKKTKTEATWKGKCVCLLAARESLCISSK